MIVREGCRVQLEITEQAYKETADGVQRMH